MTSEIPTPPLVRFKDTEANVLALFDQLQQLQLELALLQLQQRSHASGGLSENAGQDLAGDQTQFLEAKATLALRNNVVENAVALQPTLNAVHSATHASPAERDLLPTIQQRDAASVKAAKLCEDLQTAQARLAELEVEGLSISRENIKLASGALQLAESTRHLELGAPASGQFTQEITNLEGQMKSSRHRWRVMKGVASAIVAGSGVGWVQEQRLRDLVLDPPD